MRGLEGGKEDGVSRRKSKGRLFIGQRGGQNAFVPEARR